MNRERMRIAAVGVTPPNYKVSGGISAGLQLMQRIAERCETAMYIMADRDEVKLEGRLTVSRHRPSNKLLPLKSVLPRSVISMMWRPKIEAWLREFAPSIVHLHNPHPAGALALVARACAKLGIPYVISTHGFVEFNDFSRGFGAPRWQKPLLDRYVRQPVVEVALGAARVLMLSPFEENILRSMGIPADRLSVVPNGVDPFYLEPLDESDRQRLVARFSLPADRRLLLFVGNHTVNKGLDVLLRAVTMMREPAVAIIAGAIRSAADNRELISSCGLALDDPRIQFTDFVTKEELRALYHSADVFVFPSRADTLPLVILEAMCAKLPVVATDVGGIPFEVTATEGILVPPGEPAPFAAALDRICGSAELRARMGESARRRVVAQFDWNESASLALSIYDSVLAAPQS